MNPVLLLSISGFSKKQVLGVMAIIVIVVSLPLMAVAALGGDTLSFLINSLSSSDTTSAISTTTVGLYEGPEVAGDTYAWGNCTYWAYALRLKAGDPIPTTWGNADTWAFYAHLQGYNVDQTPAVGAIMQSSTDTIWGPGHVAYVTAVDPTTGAWTTSEMNAKGLDVVDITTYPASAAAKYNFIHDKGTSP